MKDGPNPFGWVSTVIYMLFISKKKNIKKASSCLAIGEDGYLSFFFSFEEKTRVENNPCYGRVPLFTPKGIQRSYKLLLFLLTVPFPDPKAGRFK